LAQQPGGYAEAVPGRGDARQARHGPLEQGLLPVKRTRNATATTTSTTCRQPAVTVQIPAAGRTLPGQRHLSLRRMRQIRFDSVARPGGSPSGERLQTAAPEGLCYSRKVKKASHLTFSFQPPKTLPSHIFRAKTTPERVKKPEPQHERKGPPSLWKWIVATPGHSGGMRRSLRNGGMAFDLSPALRDSAPRRR